MALKKFIFNVLLILSFLCCYMEWGQGNAAFVFQTIPQIFNTPDWVENLTHPIVLAGIIGVIILLLAPFLRVKYKWLQMAGIILPGLVVFIILLSGILSMHLKTILSCLPFFIIVFILLRDGNHRSSGSKQNFQ